MGHIAVTVTCIGCICCILTRTLKEQNPGTGKHKQVVSVKLHNVDGKGMGGINLQCSKLSGEQIIISTNGIRTWWDLAKELCNREFLQLPPHLTKRLCDVPVQFVYNDNGVDNLLQNISGKLPELMFRDLPKELHECKATNAP